MKKSNKIIFIAVAIGIFACCMSCVSVLPIKGNGNLKTSEMTYSPFEKINCGGSAEIRFHANETYRAVVTIDENLEEYIEIAANNNVLNIRTKNGYNISPTKFTVEVYCPVLSGVSMSGSGNFRNEDKIIVPTFESKVTGSGKIEGTVECDNYAAVITGSGKITVSGNSNDANISITGSGDLHGTELSTTNTTITITGSGSANIWVTDNLKARITGSGNVNYKGDPKVDSSVSGSGRLRKTN
jgi:hypothetical protein